MPLRDFPEERAASPPVEAIRGHHRHCHDRSPGTAAFVPRPGGCTLVGAGGRRVIRHRLSRSGVGARAAHRLGVGARGLRLVSVLCAGDPGRLRAGRMGPGRIRHLPRPAVGLVLRRRRWRARGGRYRQRFRFRAGRHRRLMARRIVPPLAHRGGGQCASGARARNPHEAYSRHHSGRHDRDR
jgi:hypothetical protein